MADVDDREVMTHSERVDYIINKGCEYFGMEKSELISACGTRNNKHRVKRYIALALYTKTETTMGTIGFMLGFGSNLGVSGALKKIKEELSDDFYGENRTKEVYNELLSYLNL